MAKTSVSIRRDEKSKRVVSKLGNYLEIKWLEDLIACEKQKRSVIETENLSFFEDLCNKERNNESNKIYKSQTPTSFR